MFLLLINIINLFFFIHVDQSVASEFERLHVCKRKLMQFDIHYLLTKADPVPGLIFKNLAAEHT